MRHSTIPIERHVRAEVAFGAIALMFLIFAAYIFWHHVTDPLVVGVPPRINGDGTIDYALIEVKSGPGGQASKAEWVLRLPAALNVNHSVQNTSGSNSAGSAPNQRLSFSVDMDGLGSSSSSSSAPPVTTSASATVVMLSAERAAPYWPRRLDDLQRGCIATPRTTGNLTQYTDRDRATQHCVLGDSATSDLFALIRNGSLDATLACVKVGNFCHYELRYHDRVVTGSFAAGKLASFENFATQLTVFLEYATVFDR
jgi:hypothetical protein